MLNKWQQQMKFNKKKLLNEEVSIGPITIHLSETDCKLFHADQEKDFKFSVCIVSFAYF